MNRLATQVAMSEESARTTSRSLGLSLSDGSVSGIPSF